MPRQLLRRHPERPEHREMGVNDGIDPDLCSLTYTSVDKVAEVIAALPRGGLLAKIDIESAYRLVPGPPARPPAPGRGVGWGHVC